MYNFRIKQLSIHVANQIAAGEVVERPASVIKELLENSLDAGADEINIEIRFGGLNQIKVSDNGFGILADDLLLAIAPHATSKMQNLDDLSTITSMGFRGEALASISSVARLILHSKPELQEHGMMVCVNEFGVELLPNPRSVGTTVDVRDLFYNAPVRKSFLKNERVEYQAIETVVKKFAIGAEHISINLWHNDKKTLSLTKVVCENSRLSRIQAIFGKNFITNANKLHASSLDFHLSGWISGENDQRSQSDKQWLYLNRRMVKDKLLQHAIMKAYQPVLHPGKYPSYLLHLTLPVNEVDVNVHPTKHEVRFKNARLIYDFVYSQVANVLQIHMPIKESKVCFHSKFAMNDQPKMPIMNVEHSYSVTEPCFVVNKRFMISHLSYKNSKNIYLLDVLEILKHQCCSQNDTIHTRPLLVPMKFHVAVDVCEWLRQSIDILHLVGFNLVFNSDSIISVHTVPTAYPWVDLQKFILNLQKPLLDLASALEHLSSCFVIDLFQWDVVQKNDVIEYVRQNVGDKLDAYCLKLDEDYCCEILRDKILKYAK